MKKEFNITGTCIPNMHYMADTSDKLSSIMELVEDGKYSAINRLRQYGKTTTMFLLWRKLNSLEDYLCIKLSFEGIGDLVFSEERKFTKEFIQMLSDATALNDRELSLFLEEQKDNVESFNDLSKAISKFIIKANKKVVLMIDEVDKSSDSQLFLSFLGMLRNKYLLKNEGTDITFHSVILASVHDVKSLKLKLNSRIYEQLIYNYKISKLETSSDFENFKFRDNFI